jgi:hypothetical protein
VLRLSDVRPPLLLGLLASLALPAFGCSGTSDFTGKIVLTGETDHSGVLVFVSGRKFSEDSVLTGANGDWHFAITSAGARYFVKAYASSTLERTQEVVVDIGEGESKVAPDIVFTPVGTMHGVVRVAGAPAEGARVAVEGTDRTATTDSAGAYTLEDVPTGTYSLRVTVDGHASVGVKDLTVHYTKATDVAPIDVP